MNLNIPLFTSVIITLNNLSFLSGAAITPSRVKAYNENKGINSNISEHDDTSSTTYDQRQSGKYNIHVNIKDVEIIAINDESLESSLADDTMYDYGDYDYDPAHLTVNPLPIFGIGSVPSTTTRHPKSTTKRPVLVSPTANVSERPQSSTEGTSSGPSNAIISASTNSTPVGVTVAHLDEKPSISLSTLSNTMADTFGTSTKSPNTSNIITSKPSLVQQSDLLIPVKVIMDPIVKPKYQNSNNPTSLSDPTAENQQYLKQKRL